MSSKPRLVAAVHGRKRTAADPAFFYPFLYDKEEYPDLVQFVTPQYGDPHGELSAWARQFLDG